MRSIEYGKCQDDHKVLEKKLNGIYVCITIRIGLHRMAATKGGNRTLSEQMCVHRNNTLEYDGENEQN